jgi:hypothetical protein
MSFFIRRSLLCFAVTLVFAPGVVRAEDLPVESAIKSAVVYSDRATVTRAAKIEIPAGAHNLVFKGLPIGLFTNSLRVSGNSEANVVFGALTHKRDTSEEFTVPRVQELSDLLLQEKAAIKAYEAEKAALTEANEFLKTWARQVFFGQGQNPDAMALNYNTWVTASDGLSAKILDNLKAGLAVEAKILDSNNKIAKINADLRQVRGGNKQSHTVTVPFEADQKTMLNVVLSYQVSNVGWAPIYDARLDMTSKKLDFIHYGSVWQNSGEDWQDIALTLSTAQPGQGAALPETTSVWLSVYKPPAPGAGEASPSYIEAVEDAEEAAFEKAVREGNSTMPVPVETPTDRLQLPEEGGGGEDPLHRWRRLQEERVLRDVTPAPVVSQINTGGFVGEYKVTGPATVKSDGTQAKLSIGEVSAEPDLFVQIKPQITTEAYIVAKIKLKGETPILPGPVNLFRDGAFIGQSYIHDLIRPGEEGKVFFGVDDGVTVKRNMLKDQTAETGLIAKSSVTEKDFSTVIKNLNKYPVRYEVVEVIPSSKDERVVVDILNDKTTAGYEKDIDQVQGATRWSGTLEPQQETTVNFGWAVSWPKEESLIWQER